MIPQKTQQFAKLYNCNEDEIQADGILNPKLYEAASPKILWILKETWVQDSWDLLGSENSYETVGGSPTYQPMAYVVHSVFNGFPTYQEMDYIRDKPEIFESLKSIAFINVKKIVGGTRSDNADISQYYNLGKELIVEQIADISPDVVIGCSPHFPDLFNAVGLSTPVSTFESVDWAISLDGRLIINAYHPQQTKINRADYVNDIIEVIKMKRSKL